MRRVQAIALMWLTAGTLLATGVRLGMTRYEVETELGRPTAAMERGERTILIYPNQGRVELIGDKVVEAAWVPIDSSSEPATPLQPLPPLPPPSPAPLVAPAEKESTEKEMPQKTAAETSAGAVDVLTEQELPGQLEAATEELAEGRSGADIGLAVPPTQFWGGLVVGAILQFGVTIVVLRAAFRWADVHADWSQMFVPALSDMAARGGVAASAYALWQTDQLFYLDEGIAYFALLFALMKTTHACTLQRAVAVSMAAKLASIVVWALLSVFVMRLAFG